MINRRLVATENGPGIFTIQMGREWSSWNSNRRSSRAAIRMRRHIRSHDGGRGMKLTRALACAVVLLVVAGRVPAKEPTRPRITAISRVTVLVSDVAVSRAAYMRLLAPRYSCDSCEESPIPGFELGSGQIIALEGAGTPQPNSLLEEIFFLTDDLKRMKSYLKSQKVQFEELRAGRVPLRLRVADPDGHHVSFVQIS